MAKQTFTTGQVLTAAQMTSLQQTAMGGGSPSTKTASYVLVAADAGTVIQMNAAGSTTITVNTALFSAGDSVQIQNIGAGVCTITAGTATVNTAGSLALSQWEGGFLYFTSASSAIFFDVVQSSGTSFPAFRAYRATDQNITANVWTKVSLNTETFDTNNNFDPTTNFRFTPTVSGYYQINGNAYLYSSTGINANWQTAIYKNGTAYATTIAIDATGGQVPVNAIVFFNGSTDYVELYARGSAGSGNNVVSGGITENYLDGVGIRS